jgi:prephenate dehydrogenase
MGTFPVRRIVIIGTGLMGGSLGMAIRRKKLAAEVTGLDAHPEALKAAVNLKAIHRAEKDLDKAVGDADLVILAIPVGRSEELAKKLSGLFQRRTVITDVGSIKGPMVKRLEKDLSPHGLFVGGHPIAGREKSGVEASSPGLFDDAHCILTPTPQTDPFALEMVKSLWEAVGSHVTLMDPERHDQIFAAVSHLPHVVAYALVKHLMELDSNNPDLLTYSAGGFRDFTRIAASSPEMWRDICLANGDQIVLQIEKYQEALNQLKKMILEKNAAGLNAEFERARGVRERLNIKT